MSIRSLLAKEAILVKTTATQTLTNKTLTSPTINTPTINTPTITTPTLTGGTSTAKRVITAASGDGAITIAAGVVQITKGSAAALSIAAPSVAQAGTIISIISTTAFAHVITFTGSTLDSGASAAALTATFANKVGANITVIAINQKWVLMDNNNATLAAA